jgi:hypothetical protein
VIGRDRRQLHADDTIDPAFAVLRRAAADADLVVDVLVTQAAVPTELVVEPVTDTGFAERLRYRDFGVAQWADTVFLELHVGDFGIGRPGFTVR